MGAGRESTPGHYADYGLGARELPERLCSQHPRDGGCETAHQFVAAGIALHNPDDPTRPVNSPKTVYQVEPATLALLRSYGTRAWHDNLPAYLAERETLAARYAHERAQNRIPVQIAPGKKSPSAPASTAT